MQCIKFLATPLYIINDIELTLLKKNFPARTKISKKIIIVFRPMSGDGKKVATPNDDDTHLTFRLDKS